MKPSTDEEPILETPDGPRTFRWARMVADGIRPSPSLHLYPVGYEASPHGYGSRLREQGIGFQLESPSLPHCRVCTLTAGGGRIALLP